MTDWKTMARSLKSKSIYYRAIAKDPRTPRLSKWLIGVAIVYLFSPIDIIPDFIPLLGQLDDLIIVPGLIWLAMQMISEDVKRDAACIVSIATPVDYGEQHL